MLTSVICVVYYFSSRLTLFCSFLYVFYILVVYNYVRMTDSIIIPFSSKGNNFCSFLFSKDNSWFISPMVSLFLSVSNEAFQALIFRFLDQGDALGLVYSMGRFTAIK